VEAEPDAAHRGRDAFPHPFQSNSSQNNKISDKYNHGDFKEMSNFDSFPAKAWGLSGFNNSPGDNNSGHEAACSIWPGNSSWLLCRPEFS
jgi:hypothetical protein